LRKYLSYWRLIAWLFMLGVYGVLSGGAGIQPKSPEQSQPATRIDSTIDTCNPYNFHLYIVLRKKHYHALLTVKDTTDRILLTRNFDSLRIGRNFFNIPIKKKLPPVVYWELKAGDLNKKGRMAIH